MVAKYGDLAICLATRFQWLFQQVSKILLHLILHARKHVGIRIEC